MVKSKLKFLFVLLILGACASKMREQMKDYKAKYSRGEFASAKILLEKSDLKKDAKSVLLWHLEQGTLSFDSNDLESAINHFQESLSLIDTLFTKKLSSKAASLFINDASDDFYGSSYERSYVYYFLSKSYYARYLKTGEKSDLQAARGMILAWDSYFSELERSGDKTLYYTDLMLKVFGAQIHEVSGINNDRQISLQLYKDAIKLLDTQGGIYSVFNQKHVDYIKNFKDEGIRPSESFYLKTSEYDDLKKFLQSKVLALTKSLRPYELEQTIKEFQIPLDITKKTNQPVANVVLVIEEGMIPTKIPKTFNFGLRGAMGSVEDSSAKKFIATVGAEAITLFAMNTLGMVPNSPMDAGGFMFAHNVTKLAVTEAAIEFELPVIEKFPKILKSEIFVMNKQGQIVAQSPLTVINDNGDLAEVILEEEVVSRYVKTGARVASRHILAIITAMGVYQKLKGVGQGGDFLAKSAALATYVGASKGLSLLEKADTRHWSTLPRSIKMSEFHLPPGDYLLGVGSYQGEQAPQKPTKTVGSFSVKSQDKSLFNFRIF